MGLLHFLFGKSTSTTIEHPFFGKIRFREFKNEPSKNHFECSRYFKPKADNIGLTITAPVDGPGQKQIDFFESIEDNYTAITATIIPLIEDEFRNWKEDFKIIDFKKEFTPVHITIPTFNTQPVIWEIVFESEHDLNHHFTLTMENFTATEILIDG